MAIAERSALSTDFPLRAERYLSASLCQVFDPVKASLTDVVKEAATLLVSPAVLGFIRRYMLPALSRDGIGGY